jgi:hypothetical protein
MLVDRLKAYLNAGELRRIMAEAKSSQRRISVDIASPLCGALERAALDGNVPKSDGKVPRRILQFWDQKTIPPDVLECMATWRAIPDFDYVVFDDDRAREFFRTEYDARHLDAYELCNHPAMKSDLFRLAYLYRHGGVYVDADDAYEGAGMDPLSGEDGNFRLRAASFRKAPSEPPVTIFNNNPIFCVPKDEILRKALDRATTIMLALGKRESYNVLVTTGPVNLSVAVYATALDCIANDAEFRFAPIIGWDRIAKKNTHLEYQKTEKNWRASR